MAPGDESAAQAAGAGNNSSDFVCLPLFALIDSCGAMDANIVLCLQVRKLYK